ncbi:MAG TPA: tetratricopeptide repeat protein [Cytophagaceae bacterium]|jgi:tetratricopeptide (TPR) repeat protein|nr:tetratricopeptide repeat protein [Cytophagaceae bacterium]
MEKTNTKVFIIKKIWPLLVSAGGASVMILAFFIPSVQYQWDRYQSRLVIQQYVQMGDEFVKEENYDMAQKAFTKAYELSEEKRLDIEVKILSAKVNLIYQDTEWGSKPPEELEEVDFEFLLQLQKGPEHTHERASILTSYGIYLASLGKTKEAKNKIQEAIRLNAGEVLAYINLGNLLDQEGKKEQAGKAYRQAISIDTKNARAHYNLGLLLSEQDNLKEAEREFAKAIELDSNDTDAIIQYRLILRRIEDDKP